MDKITRIFTTLLYFISTFCIGSGYKLEAIYFVLSAIYMSLGLLIDKKQWIR
jgi:hypothetical protein